MGSGVYALFDTATGSSYLRSDSGSLPAPGTLPAVGISGAPVLIPNSTNNYAAGIILPNQPLKAAKRRSAALNSVDGSIASLRQDLANLYKVADGEAQGVIEIPALHLLAQEPVNFTSSYDYWESAAQLFAFSTSVDNLDRFDFNSCAALSGGDFHSDFGSTDYYPYGSPVGQRCRHALRRRLAEDVLQDTWATLSEYWHNQQTMLRLKVSRYHAAFLISMREYLLISALSVKRLSVRMLAHACCIVSSVLTIIAIFMGHRHRHEPADGWLLSPNINAILGGMH